MPKIQKLKPQPASDAEISGELDRMLNSQDFKASPQQVALLKFIVEQTLAGNAHEIKGYTVAIQVFGRGPDFDQSVDPVVSVQASRLRRAMERYYMAAGKHDPIRIDIPKGRYVPTFSEQFPRNQPIAAEPAAPDSNMQTWPTVLVRPLANLTANPDDDYLSIGLTAELAHALNHYKEIRILEALHRNPNPPLPDSDIEFIIDGSVRRDSMGIRVAIKLCEAKRCAQIWSGKYQGDLEAAKMIAFQEEVAATVAVLVAGDNGTISKHHAGMSRNKAASELTTYEAMLRYWESNTLLSPRSLVRAIRALEAAVVREPDCVIAWSMLGSLYADNYHLEIVDLATPLEKAAEFAQRGVSLDPTNRRVRLIMGYVRYLENNLQEARYEAETAYNLCPNSLLVLDGIGWLMALAGGWERGIKWIKKAIKLNPYYLPWVRYPLCFNWLRLGNYEKTYQETIHFMMPELFWDPLLKAAACGHLGRNEEGQACVRALLALKPDFAQRGRILIGRYVKFEDIVDRIIEGLGKLGMKIAS